MSDRAIYWSSGGEILALNQALSLNDARALRGLHFDEARAAVKAGDLTAARQALRLTEELTRAIDRSRRWRRAARSIHMGLPSPARS